jgi:hypothetical protein
MSDTLKAKSLIGGLVGFDQQAAIKQLVDDAKVALPEAVENLFGGMTIDEWFEKLGDDKQLGFTVGGVGGKLWLEPKPKKDKEA